MKYINKLKLAAIEALCNSQDKSTEYMIELMKSSTGINHDGVMNYLQSDNTQIHKEFNELLELLEILSNNE